MSVSQLGSSVLQSITVAYLKAKSGDQCVLTWDFLFRGFAVPRKLPRKLHPQHQQVESGNLPPEH
jgi:hypothetical protein